MAMSHPPSRQGQLPEPHAAAAATLDAVPFPTWLCRADGHILHANAAAALGPGSAPWPCVHLDRIGPPHPADAAAWMSALHSAALHAHGAWVVRLDGDDAPGPAPTTTALLHVQAIAGNATLMATWPQAAALVIWQRRAGAPADDPAALQHIQQRYRLTPSESAVLADVVKGHKVTDIARQRRIQVATVRCHLRAIFEKTDRRRQVDLVRLVTCG